MHTDGILGAVYYGWRLGPLARPHDVSQETAISVRAQVNGVVEELNTLALMRQKSMAGFCPGHGRARWWTEQ